MDNIGFECLNEDIVIECEQQVNSEQQVMEGECISAKSAEKRRSSDTDEMLDDEGFTTVCRSRKKVIRSLSDEDRNIEVLVTSKQVLPKQIAFAKLLREENIQNILRIKYKGPYKVSIQFETEEMAEKLVKNKKFEELDYRCQRSNSVSICYGVIKNVEIEVDEKEILENFECEYPIICMKRLKRKDDDGAWIDSDSVRLGFKGSSVPSYVYGYGCRFRVNTFKFPVSQCSVCWKFGHLSRQCPTRKIICPKCGGKHANCDTDIFMCVNCKGPHISLSKECPIFKKEQEIREIMTRENYTYRRALTIYLAKRRGEGAYIHKVSLQKQQDGSEREMSPIISHTTRKSYKEVLVTDAIIHREEVPELDDEKEKYENTTKNGITKGGAHKQNKEENTAKKNTNDRKILKKKKDPVQKDDDENTESQEQKDTEETNDVRQNKNNFKHFFLEAKIIFFEDKPMQEKIQDIIVLFVKVLLSSVGEFFKNFDVIDKLFTTNNDRKS